MKRFTLLLAFLWPVWLLFCQSDLRMIDSKSELYNLACIIALDSGKCEPFVSRPVTVSEMRRFALDTSEDLLSPAGKKALSALKAALRFKPLLQRESFSFSFQPSFWLEGYYNSNPDCDWQFGYEDRQSFLSIPLSLSIGANAFAYVDIALKEEYRAISEDLANYTNIPKSLSYIDWYFPPTAYIAFGGDFWNVQFGRDRINWGNGISGNLVISDNADFHDLLKLKLHWPWFSYTAAYVVLDSWLTPEESAYWNVQANAGWYENYNELYKAFMGHRFDFNILGKVNLALTESAVFGNKYPQLSDFNPVMILHNYFIPERSNSMLGLEVDINPWRFFSLSGQFALDEFQTAYEEGRGARPGAIAWLVNFRAAYPLGPGHLRAFGEYAQLDPWMYNRWHVNTKFTTRRRIWSYIPPDGYEWIHKPLGHSAGPDSKLAFCGLSYLGLGFNAGAQYRWWKHSNITIDTEYDLYNPIESLRSIWMEEHTLDFFAELDLPWGFQTNADLIFNWYSNYRMIPGNNPWSVELVGSIGWQY